MLKKILSIAALCLMGSAGITMAQTPEITRSPGFEEPGDGVTKLLEMKNGSTMFFHFRKKGIEATVYDEQHKMALHMKSRIGLFKSKKLPKSFCQGIYEMNGQVVMFILRYAHRKPLLYRFTFDGKSGKLVDEKVIADMDKMSITAGYSIVYGGVGLPSFYVMKDPESDYYAIATLNTFAHESNARIKITHYSPEHQIINEGYYESPNNQYKYLNLKDMYVHGDEYVLLTTFGYNTARSGGKESGTFVSKLSKGSNEIKGVYMNSSSKSNDASMMGMKYNPANKQLYVLSSIKAKSLNMDYTMTCKEGDMVLQMNTIDPETLEISKDNFINHPELSDYAKKNLKYKHPYTGVIQDFRLHDDGSTTIMFEELDATLHTYTSSYSVNGSTHTTSSSYYITKLGDIGVVHVNKDGKELPGSYAIAKSQFVDGWLSPYYVYGRSGEVWNANGQKKKVFFSFDYLYANNRAYTMYNDFKENVNKKSENYRHRKKMRTISDANTVLAWFDGEKIQRSYLFGDPGNKDIARFSRLDMNTHRAGDKSFSTLMIERKGHRKQAYIVWVKF